MLRFILFHVLIFYPQLLTVPLECLCHIHRFLQVQPLILQVYSSLLLQLWAFRLGLCIYFSLSPSIAVTLN